MTCQGLLSKYKKRIMLILQTTWQYIPAAPKQPTAHTQETPIQRREGNSSHSGSWPACKASLNSIIPTASVGGLNQDKCLNISKLSVTLASWRWKDDREFNWGRKRTQFLEGHFFELTAFVSFTQISLPVKPTSYCTYQWALRQSILLSRSPQIFLEAACVQALTRHLPTETLYMPTAKYRRARENVQPLDCHEITLCKW